LPNYEHSEFFWHLWGLLEILLWFSEEFLEIRLVGKTEDVIAVGSSEFLDALDDFAL
jgi:hypothetical protein